MRSCAPSSEPSGGFTLLELVLAIGLLALLIAMIFGLASQQIGLGNAVVESQNQVSEETALFELLDDRFSSLPGNARMELRTEDSGAQYLSDITIEGVPLSFNWGGTELVAKAVQLSTERRRDGFLDIVLRYFEEEQLAETTGAGASRGISEGEPFAEVVLMEDVYIFEWRVLDGRTMEWDYTWDLAGRQPLQMELTFVRTPFSEPIRQIFWITPKENPEVAMRTLQQGAAQPPPQEGRENGAVPEQPPVGTNGPAIINNPIVSPPPR